MVQCLENCIFRSASHKSKSEVMCLITSLGVQATGKKNGVDTEFLACETGIERFIAVEMIVLVGQDSFASLTSCGLSTVACMHV